MPRRTALGKPDQLAEARKPPFLLQKLRTFSDSAARKIDFPWKWPQWHFGCETQKTMENFRSTI
jgi:hypothetical protein